MTIITMNMGNRPSTNVFWFKRDLRLRDQDALNAAIEVSLANKRPLLLLYCFEPSVVSNPNYDLRHWRFVTECLADLNKQLAAFPKHGMVSTEDKAEKVRKRITETGQKVIWIFHREVTDVLQALQQYFTIDRIFSNEETGLKVTYDRDKAVAKYCRAHEITWNEFPSSGVIRRLKDQSIWYNEWKKTMIASQKDPDLLKWNAPVMPYDLFAEQQGADLPAAWNEPNSLFQPGGETNAHSYMDSFFKKRLANYAQFISKPLESRTSCSRLSPYLAWGCLSTRQVYQAHKQANFKGLGSASSTFGSRLRARGYFMQTFESDDRTEFENASHLSATVEKNTKPDNFAAWRDGRTGYPLVDASMRCLMATGWVNFRMRCMVTSFLTHLLLHKWQEGAIHLARMFTDFEPGIHYGQIQMQAGTSGMNSIRIFNPVKQSREHDPLGVFIKQWIPELANCPDTYIHEPWQMPQMEQDLNHFHIGVDYSAPIVDYRTAYGEARFKLNKPRQTDEGQAERDQIKSTRPVYLPGKSKTN